MKLLTTAIDDKIEAENHLIEMNIGEYSSFAKHIISNNSFQRKRVITANRTYSLLKDDIKVGCVIPPIVLAIFPSDKKNNINANNILDKIQKGDEDLLILDGLQRTYTILDLLEESKFDKPVYDKVVELPLRIELYTGISKVGVLYRMLTLNTGQTPMSTRHQVEMVYSDYKKGVDGITFISETDNRPPTGINEYKFSDVLDAFLSYITGDYLPIDREDLIETIKNLEAVTRDDKQKDVFRLLINTYNMLRLHIDYIAGMWIANDTSLVKKAFARNVNELFSKVQMLAGFGAGVSFLIEKELIPGIEAVADNCDKVKIDDPFDTLNRMMKDLDNIQITAKKIGNEQRMYFYYFIRSLFNPNNDAYLNIDMAVTEARKFHNANMY